MDVASTLVFAFDAGSLPKDGSEALSAQINNWGPRETRLDVPFRPSKLHTSAARCVRDVLRSRNADPEDAGGLCVSALAGDSSDGQERDAGDSSSLAIKFLEQLRSRGLNAHLVLASGCGAASCGRHSTSGGGAACPAGAAAAAPAAGGGAGGAAGSSGAFCFFCSRQPYVVILGEQRGTAAEGTTAVAPSLPEEPRPAAAAVLPTAPTSPAFRSCSSSSFYSPSSGSGVRSGAGGWDLRQPASEGGDGEAADAAAATEQHPAHDNNNQQHPRQQQQGPEEEGEGEEEEGEEGEVLVVEPRLRELFRVAPASAEYTAALQQLPEVWVGPRWALLQLASDMVGRMALNFRIQGLDIPPWRRRAAVMGRWADRHLRHLRAPPPPPLDLGSPAAITTTTTTATTAAAAATTTAAAAATTTAAAAATTTAAAAATTTTAAAAVMTNSAPPSPAAALLPRHASETASAAPHPPHPRQEGCDAGCASRTAGSVGSGVVEGGAGGACIVSRTSSSSSTSSTSSKVIVSGTAAATAAATAALLYRYCGGGGGSGGGRCEPALVVLGFGLPAAAGGASG